MRKLKRTITEALISEVEKRAPFMGANKIAAELGIDDGTVTTCTDILLGRKHENKLKMEKLALLKPRKELSELEKKFDFFKPIED